MWYLPHHPSGANWSTNMVPSTIYPHISWHIMESFILLYWLQSASGQGKWLSKQAKHTAGCRSCGDVRNISNKINTATKTDFSKIDFVRSLFYISAGSQGTMFSCSLLMTVIYKTWHIIESFLVFLMSYPARLCLWAQSVSSYNLLTDA